MRHSGIGYGVAAFLMACGVANPAQPALIPWPAKIDPAPASFTVNARTPICASGDAAVVATQLQETVRGSRGVDLAVRACGRPGISLLISATAAAADAEGYVLDVGAGGMRIESRTQTGLYYGAMTAAQLLASEAKDGAAVELSGVHIEDSPRFKWRGLMLDPARHFLPVDDVKRIIEQMGQHKLNMLHLHLTDDQGWRIEIKRYPELTKVGAWRTPPTGGGPPENPGKYGGFYTQADIRDIVAFAAARHITVVPEIDMPGHAQALVAAHPKMSVPGDQPQVSGDWGVNPYLFNTNAESVKFVENVLDEIMALFPGKYVHLGGDEAVKDQWKASPAIQAQMKSLGIADEEAMQSWFMEQLGRYLAGHGRVMVGWDEILEGGVPQAATVMSWRGTQGAIRAARLGHDVVLSPAPTLYFDNLQSRRDDEPAGRLAIAPLSQVYNFEVMPTVLNAEEARHVLGAQANLWSEYLLSGWYVQHAAFPRVDALSEALWSRASSMNWSGFLERLAVQIQRYRRQGIEAADSAFAVDFQLAQGRNRALSAGGGAVTLVSQTDFGQIRYTLDGSAPTLESKLYSAPLELKLGVEIKAATFTDRGLPLATARSYRFDADTLLTRISNQLRPCAGGDFGLRVPLTPDSPAVSPVYDIDLFHDCFLYPMAPLDGVKGLGLNIARLARNYGLAHEAKFVKVYPARTPFGEMVVYRDRCETGDEVARVPLADPATSANRNFLRVPMPATTGEHDLCVLFTAPTNGPFYAIDDMKLLLQE